MADYKAQRHHKSKLHYSALGNVGRAIEEDMFERIVRWRIKNGKPLLKLEAEFVLRLLDQRKRVKRVKVEKRKLESDIGLQIEFAIQSGSSRNEAMADAARIPGVTPSAAAKAHTMAMRLAKRAPRAGPGSEK